MKGYKISRLGTYEQLAKLMHWQRSDQGYLNKEQIIEITDYLRRTNEAINKLKILDNNRVREILRENGLK